MVVAAAVRRDAVVGVELAAAADAEVTRHGKALREQDDEAGTQQAIDALGKQPRQGHAGQQRIEPHGHAATSSQDVGRRAEGQPQPMMTIVTRVTLKEGSEPTWDAVMRERMESARTQRG